MGCCDYEGGAAADPLLAGRPGSGAGAAADLVIYLGTFSKILLRAATRLGGRPTPVLENLNLANRVGSLFLAGHAAVRRAYSRSARRSGAARWLGYLQQLSDLYRRRAT